MVDMTSKPKLPRPGIPVESIDWVASTPKSRDLPKTVLKGLLLSMDLLATVAAAGALTRLQLANAISDISLTLEGSDNVINKIPFRHFWFEDWYDSTKEPYYSISVVEGAGKVLRLCVYLPFAFRKSVVPEDSTLDLRGNQSAVLSVNWAAAAISATHTITSGQLKIDALEYGKVDDLPIARHEYTFISQALSHTGANDVKLDRGKNNQLRRLFIYTKAAAGTFSDVEIDNLKVNTRGFDYNDISSWRLQALNELEYGLAHQTGVHVIDLTTHGKNSQRLDARAITELLLTVNALLATGTIEVVQEKAIYG